jgi:acetolactate decarboxylase
MTVTKLFAALILLWPLLGISATNDINHTGVLFQVSTIGALAQGVYDGNYRYKNLALHGNFGLGTFNHLNGEMIAVDGQFFQMIPDGRLTLAKPNEKTPFAEVTFFVPQIQFTVDSIKNIEELTTLLKTKFQNKNVPYAIKINGTFDNMKLRAVYPQKKPYPTLAEAAKTQAIFNFNHTTGTIVGFWFPEYWSQIAVAGLHLHFVTADRSKGGHILELNTNERTQAELQPLQEAKILLPNDKEFSEANLSDASIAQSVQKAEKK